MYGNCSIKTHYYYYYYYYIKYIGMDIESISQWCTLNSLSLNPSKTQTLLIANKTYLDKLPVNTHQRFLGFDSHSLHGEEPWRHF